MLFRWRAAVDNDFADGLWLATHHFALPSVVLDSQVFDRP